MRWCKVKPLEKSCPSCRVIWPSLRAHRATLFDTVTEGILLSDNVADTGIIDTRAQTTLRRTWNTVESNTAQPKHGTFPKIADLHAVRPNVQV